MARPQPKYPPTDEHARRIARAIAKGRPPPFGDELDCYCQDSPGEIFKDEALALGYLFLLQRLLEFLRYRTDSSYAEAAKLIAEFQTHVVARVNAGDVDANMLAFVGGALHQAKIPASPELVAATVKQPLDQNEDEALPADMILALTAVIEECGGDLFMAAGSLMETGHAMPAEARAAMASALADLGTSDVRGLGLLFLLDPDPSVRRAVAQALARVAASLTPVDVRRLIAMRNWRPESERAELDAVIRAARAAGIDCAQWKGGSVETIVASAIDGVTAQGFLMISPAGRKKRVSSIVTKGGIGDAWSGAPESRREIEASLAVAGLQAPMLAVSRSYLDRTVAHQLALTIEKGGAPPFGLLQVAETIGGADWRPARLVFADALAELLADVPQAMCEPAAVASVLRESNRLADPAIVQCWFEDDPEALEVVKKARGRNRARVADATDGPRSLCARRPGCARHLRMPACAGANLRSSPKLSPMGGT